MQDLARRLLIHISKHLQTLIVLHAQTAADLLATKLADKTQKEILIMIYDHD